MTCDDRTARDVERDGTDSPLPDCPRCGDPITAVTAAGPHTGTASPCGCPVPPGVIKRQHEE